MNKTDVLIIGAGPTGLFCAHQLGIIGLSCEIVDNLDKAGGQCIELYPDKPIYDIPAVPECTGEELTNNLLQQIKPFNVKFHLNERVEELKKVEDRWHVKTNSGQEFDVASIVIAGGVGSFEPRKFSIESAEKFNGTSILYSVKDKSIFKNKSVAIFGGGDSALDWTVELAGIAKSIKLVHRRDEFRGAPNTETQMRELVKTGEVELKTPYVIENLLGIENIEGAIVKNFDTKETEEIQCDEILFLFGLNKKLGPIAEWGIDMHNKKISVDTEKFETSTKGLFAVGDINDYPGKLDLILCGFHETTLAVQEAFRRSNPGERVPFGYTTSNTKLQKKLGVTD